MNEISKQGLDLTNYDSTAVGGTNVASTPAPNKGQ